MLYIVVSYDTCMRGWLYRSAPATPHLACWPPSILFQCNQPLVWGGVLMDHSCIMHRGASELLSCMLYAGMVDIYSMAVFIFIFIYYHYHCALLIPALTLPLSHRLACRQEYELPAMLPFFVRSSSASYGTDGRPAVTHKNATTMTTTLSPIPISILFLSMLLCSRL